MLHTCIYHLILSVVIEAKEPVEVHWGVTVRCTVLWYDIHDMLQVTGLLFITTFCYSNWHIFVKKPVPSRALQAPFHIECLVIPTADLFRWKFSCISRILHVGDSNYVDVMSLLR